MVVSPPVVPFFVLFFTLGGWLLVLLTAWFSEWSGLASLGMSYLIFIAPVLTAVLSWRGNPGGNPGTVTSFRGNPGTVTSFRKQCGDCRCVAGKLLKV
jgi:hypothetical protein